MRKGAAVTLLQRACRVVRATAADPPPDLHGLRPYQGEGVLYLRACADAGDAAILADEMGLGKTAQTLRALPRRARAIVVCPASVQLVWREEAHRWRRDLRVSAWGRRAPAEGEVCVTSYDSLPAVDRGRPRLVADDMSRVVLILDEAHRCNHASAQRTQKVRRLVRQCGATWALTGTPMVGTPEDLHGLLVTLGLFGKAFPGGLDVEEEVEEGGVRTTRTRPETSREEYDRLCGTTYRRYFDRRRMAEGTYPVWGTVSPEVHERLKRVMLRRTRADHLDLPPARWIDVPCEAPADLRDHLDEVTEAWERYDPEKKDLPPFELYSAATAALARSRAGAARDLAEDVSRDRPVLVFSAHVDPVLEVGRIRGAVRITGAESDAERRRAVAAFREGRSRVLAMTLGAGGEGLNLPEAGAVILVDEAFLPSVTDQAVARALRPGQRHEDVPVYRMASDHPLDLRVREILDGKRRIIGAAVDGRAGGEA